ncbi:MAG: XRE family transcriptional regulator [Actinobacteria bacterium]|uniref:XRE family transcriptional regulator n=1 Tax=Candidatus Fonsibacter lacus TaxID=2576439 RepID=A0A965GEF6_9PROT|nr:XRE family transcriptional regulator [Candidatus Fonsibacter lacus]
MKHINAVNKATAKGGDTLLRSHIGAALRRVRSEQGQTLRQLSREASVSLGYLSEIERGQKEASSELLAAICAALQLPISQLLLEVSESMTLMASSLKLACARQI